MSSHILKKSLIALTYSTIVKGVTESKRSFMFLTAKKRLRIYANSTQSIRDAIERLQTTFNLMKLKLIKIDLQFQLWLQVWGFGNCQQRRNSSVSILVLPDSHSRALRHAVTHQQQWYANQGGPHKRLPTEYHNKLTSYTLIIVRHLL